MVIFIISGITFPFSYPVFIIYKCLNVVLLYKVLYKWQNFFLNIAPVSSIIYPNIHCFIMLFIICMIRYPDFSHGIPIFVEQFYVVRIIWYSAVVIICIYPIFFFDCFCKFFHFFIQVISRYNFYGIMFALFCCCISLLVILLCFCQLVQEHISYFLCLNCICSQCFLGCAG